MPASNHFRVLHIQKVAGIGGSEKHLLSLLPRLRDFGLIPEMLVLSDPEDHPEPFIEQMKSSGVYTHLMTISGDFDPGLLFKLKNLFCEEKYDLIHTHLIHADLYGIWAARFAGVKLIVSSRHEASPFRKQYLIRLLSCLSCRQSDCIICISENLKRYTKTIDWLKLTKLRTIYYGLDLNLDSGNSISRKGLSQVKKVPVIGNVARLTEAKGHTTLLQAMPKVLENFPDVKLVIIGDGELREMLKKCQEQLGLTECVEFWGFKNDPVPLMSEFDVFVHPSRWEGFGLVFLEAMASRLPIVATRVGAIPEIVEHGETGILVDVDDSDALAAGICELLNNPSLARDMGNSGRRRLEEKFTLDKMVEETSEVYFSLLSKLPPN